MKKTSLFKIIIALTLVLCLSACVTSEFVNLSSFIYNFNHETDFHTINFEDFYYTEEDDTNIYIAFFSEVDGEYVSLKIIENSQKQVMQCFITFSKVNQSGEFIQISTSTKNLFESVVKKTIEAFTLNDETFADQIILDFMLDDIQTYIDEGELSKSDSNFQFLYLSNTIANEFVIYNTWLLNYEDVEKAQSYAAYDSTTDIRDGTVALR